jgi:hypothetical protein
MNGIAVLKEGLAQSKDWMMALITDMKDAPTTFPTPKGGNHPLWVIGHLAYSEASIINGFVLGEQNPLAKWESLFGMGSEPVADASKYPSMDELRAAFEQVRGRTLQLLDSYTDADLDRPSKAPPEYKAFFGTIGQCLITTCIHVTFHAGQAADARRTLGRKPVLA